jgi:hypothetical protein
MTEIEQANESGIQVVLLLTEPRIKQLILRGLRRRKLTPRSDYVMFFQAAVGVTARVEITAPRKKTGKRDLSCAEVCELLTAELATEGCIVTPEGITFAYKPHPDSMYGDGLSAEVVLEAVPDKYPHSQE